MKPTISLLAAACATALVGLPASAADLRTSPVMTHPSQGDVTRVADANARMVMADNGVFVSFDTQGLKSGHVHTLWFVAIAAPENCASTPCSGKDVLMNSDVVQSDAGFAGGAVADANGTIRFTHFQPEGDLINGWFDRGLSDPSRSEIHLVVKDHGPAIEERLGDMLTTFRDGCTTESISPAFPAAAFADGNLGPNTFALVQFTTFASDQIAEASEN